MLIDRQRINITKKLIIINKNRLVKYTNLNTHKPIRRIHYHHQFLHSPHNNTPINARSQTISTNITKLILTIIQLPKPIKYNNQAFWSKIQTFFKNENYLTKLFNNNNRHIGKSIIKKIIIIR